jgi:hypothetical protein
MQGKQLLLAVTTGMAVLCVAGSALAGNMSLPYGWYIEGNVGSTHLADKNYPGSASSSGVGGNANVGYKFMPYFAAEVGYSLYANTSIKDQTDTTAGSDKHYSYDIAGKGILPLGQTGTEAFAKVGAVRNKSHVTLSNAVAASNIGLESSQHSATGLYIGVGAQYYVTPEAALVVQWADALGNSQTGDMSLFTVGGSLIFG